MRQVKCYECGKSYDYEEDGFCPKCGSFNQPPKGARVGADGTVMRLDGLNEQNHKNSFVHQEFHAEKQKRSKYGLDKSAQYIQKVVKDAAGTRLKAEKKDNPVKQNPLNIKVFGHKEVISN